MKSKKIKIKIKFYNFKKYLNLFHLFIKISSSKKNNSPTLIFSHQSNETLGDIYPFLMDLSSMLKCNIISYDYSNYGCSSKTTEKGIQKNLSEVLYFSTKFLHIQHNQIILVGHSQGSIPTIYEASSEIYSDILGVVLFSPISQAAILGKHQIKDLKKKPVINYDNKSKIGQVKCPIFLVHGKEDKVISFSHSVELVKNIKSLYKWFPKSGNHFNFFKETRYKFFQKFKFFLEYLNKTLVVENDEHRASNEDNKEENNEDNKNNNSDNKNEENKIEKDENIYPQNDMKINEVDVTANCNENNEEDKNVGVFYNSYEEEEVNAYKNRNSK